MISGENPDGPVRASSMGMHGIEKRIVYIIRSDVDPSRHYVGITNDLPARLQWQRQAFAVQLMSHLATANHALVSMS